MAMTVRHDPDPAGTIPAVLAIDVEPDGRPARPASGLSLDGLAATVRWLEPFRERFLEVTGRRTTFNWFMRMDPQITELAGRPDAIALAGADDLATLVARGDAIGLHTHAGRWDPSRGRWVVDHADPAWIEHCVVTSFEAFTTRYGQAARQHRFGDRWSSTAALDQVARLGAVVDLSIEPGFRGAARVDASADATGRVPSYLHMRSIPQRHGGSDLTILPLTSGDPGPALPLARRVARRLRFIGQPRHRPLLLDRGWRSSDLYWSVIERTVGSLPVPYVAWAVRSDLVLSERFAGAHRLLERLLTHPLLERLDFTDAVSAVERLRMRSTEPVPGTADIPASN